MIYKAIMEFFSKYMKKVYFILSALAVFICFDANAFTIKNYDKRSYELEITSAEGVKKVKIFAKGYINFGDNMGEVRVKLLEREVMATGNEKINIKNRKIGKESVTEKKEGQDLFRL